ncbi:ATPase expression protein [Schizosaccharomyces japonicus yFS275]|uniref:ATPase expression protein n=1 Tax=Schizosaccharomyces japonicus (strain yFS275 / FY16936) TaxID=402676 RepID=B6K4W0_SCHJY|nr:ATPase expression protein [Schizosaccharomyces japonicus yFS275]EEB08517.1 ATPase expression protein [Schizosaccharomyces japonicus yFS275]
MLFEGLLELLRQPPSEIQFRYKVHEKTKKLAEEVKRGDLVSITKEYNTLRQRKELSFISRHLYQNLLRSLRPAKSEQKSNIPIPLIASTAFKIFRDVVRQDVQLSINDCNHLLHLSFLVGNRKLANQIQMYVKKNKLSPNRCYYNSIISLIVGRKAELKRHLRYQELCNNSVSSYQQRVLDVINQSMKEHGIFPNAMSFDQLFLSIAKDNEPWKMHSFLQSHYGVFLNGENIKKYSLDDILYPTTHTLSAVVTGFCAVDDIKNAFAYLEALSTLYQLSVPKDVWQRLLQYAASSRSFKPTHYWLLHVFESYLSSTNGFPAVDILSRLLHITCSKHYILTSTLLYERWIHLVTCSFSLWSPTRIRSHYEMLDEHKERLQTRYQTRFKAYDNNFTAHQLLEAGLQTIQKHLSNLDEEADTLHQLPQKLQTK